jgi:hypothetical protein
MFLTVGDEGTILTSPHGSTWTRRTTNTTDSFHKIIYGKEMFVTAGEDRIFTSLDGFTWTPGTAEALSKIT